MTTNDHIPPRKTRRAATLFAAMAVLVAGVFHLSAQSSSKPTPPNPFGHLKNKQQAREALGAPRESKPLADLPRGALTELERLGLRKNAKSFDRFDRFRYVTSLPATPGIDWIYVVYDDKDGVVYTFKRFID